MSSTPSRQPVKPHRQTMAGLAVVVGALLHAFGWQAVLESTRTSSTFISDGAWKQLVAVLGGSVTEASNGVYWAEIDFVPLFGLSLFVTLGAWLIGGFVLSRTSRVRFGRISAEWGWGCGIGASILGLWQIARIAAILIGWDRLELLIAGTANLWAAVGMAGWLAMFFWLMHRSTEPSPPAIESVDNYRVPWGLWLAVGMYVVIFTTMNWQLYRGLLVPHGDSAMYEEHLWNITHGKGFRSYLDQGLFLGEHVQVIHLLLIPLHWLWPSQMMLELCESVALASGAIPVYWLARRHTESHAAALALGCAYLLYAPLQFLDIAVDLKTFRPISFGVPLFLLALDALERGKTRRMLLFLLLALSAKEDFALVIAPLGVWLLCCRGCTTSTEFWNRRRRLCWGIGMLIAGIVYLLLVTRVILPWFRGGEQVHYVRYFAKLGGSVGEIVRTMLFKPDVLLSELLTLQTVIYGLWLLVPVAFMPLLSPSRCLVGAPLFALLCLNEIAKTPTHHFHAPIIPVVFWAAAAGMNQAGRFVARIGQRRSASADNNAPAASTGLSRFILHLVWTSALATGIWLGRSPVSVAFWDPYSFDYWRHLYVPGKRAEMFEKIAPLIPQNARVASTDFVHPRFTHCERSYDYSQYPRKVAGNKPGAPPDTDYIVIDTRHYYSDFHSLNDIAEYRESPDDWEVLPDATDGYFIVLKRKWHK